MIVHDDEREEDEIEEGELTSVATSVQMNLSPMGEFQETIELSLNSIMGLSMPGTMKIRGKLGTKAMMILIDCGAIHNFLSIELVDLKLSFLPKI